MHTPLIFALFALSAPLQEPAAAPTGTIHGTVVSETTGAPLPFAVIELIGVPQPVRVMADSAGRYTLEEVRAGRVRLRASHADHTSLEVEVIVPARRVVALGFELQLQPIALPPVTARASPSGDLADSTAASEPTLTAAAVRALEATPGMAELGLGDLGSVGDTEPPHGPADPSSVLFVRGGAADLKRVLLDGAPVYSPFHVGGLIPPFEPALLSAATLYLGGAPARYDGGLSYILDLRTRAGKRDAVHAAASADLLAAEARVEGPLGGGGGFLAAGRAVHPLAGALLSSDAFPYEYADALLRADFEVGKDGQIGATTFWNREAVALDDELRADARWGNAAGSLRYEGPLAGATASLVAGFGRYQARLPIVGEDAMLADGVVEQVRVGADFARAAGPLELRYGAAYERLWLHYGAWPRTGVEGDPVAEARAAGDVAGTYMAVDWQPAPSVRLRGGMRADRFSLDDGFRIAPRLSATWLVSDRAALTLAAGRYHQYVRAPEPTLAELTAEDTATSSGSSPQAPLSVAAASHVVLTLEQELGERIGLGLEGFFKRFSGLPTERPRARASGVDVWLRRTGAGITGWAGYSLAWVWSPPDDTDTSERFSGRQLLSAGLAGPLGSAGRFELRLAYGAGLPYTAIPTAGVVGENAPNDPALDMRTIASAAENEAFTAPLDEPYLRVDAQLSHTWKPRWRGVDWTVTPYLKVLNALDQRDALFYYYDPDHDAEPRPLGTLPVLPVLGVRWSF